MIFSYHPGAFKHFRRLAKVNKGDPFSKEIAEYDFYSRKNNPLYWVGRFMTNAVPVDRTNQLNLLKVDVSPIPKVDYNFSKSFSQVCYDTATDYWTKHDDISVLWSGGLDSTCVAVAMIETKPIDKKLKLIGSIESIEEYPDFYERHKDIIDIVSSNRFWKLFAEKQSDTYYVTGDIGDQIFGGCIYKFGDKKNEDWENFIEWDDIFRQSKMQDPEMTREWKPREKSYFLDRMAKFNSQAPFPITTLFDFVWWLTFTTRVNGAGNNITVLTTEVNGLKKAVFDTYSPFFLNYDFQQWAMTHHEEKYPGNLTTYKKPAKDFIIQHTKDYEFILNKKKEESTPRLLGDDNWFQNWTRNKESNYLIMNDGTIYGPGNDIPFYELSSLLNI